jgi:predicted Co/Zn/Cd cation transporter (cation efflux family)
MTGAMFALLALAALNSALRAWRNGAENWIVALPIAYALVMAYFAVTSFRFAKRVN